MAKKTNDTPIKDGLTKDERRNRNLKLKADAKQRAFDEKLNWFDDIPAAQFHQNFDEAFKIATTHAKATELLVNPSAPISVTTTEEPKTVAEKAADAVERFEERQKTAAELTVEAAKAALSGNVANDNTETKADEPGTTGASNVATDETAETATVESTTANDAEGADTVAATDTPSVDTVEKPTEQDTPELVNEFDENGKLIRWEGESSKKYGQRAHKAKLAKWDKKPAEQETRNGEPPTEKSYPEGKLDYHSDHDGQSVKLPGIPTPSEINKALPLDAPVELPGAIADPMLKRPDESKKAWKARVKLLREVKAELDTPQEVVEPTKSAIESANVFEAAAMGEQTTAETVPDATDTGTEEAPTTEAPVVDTPAEEAPNEQPAEVQEPVQTEPVSKPVEPGPSEAKTDKKPTLTLVSNNPKPTRPASTVEGAKKFYGSAWNDERAANLTDAFHWLSCAVEEETAGRPLDSGKGKLYLKQALINESKAFGVAQAMAA